VPAAITIDRGLLDDFCRRWQIAEMALFGSVLREDFEPESDVDVLVRFRPESGWGLLDQVAMESELSQIVGRDVDLITRSAVERSPNRIRRDAILRSAETIYEHR